jgi:hypothetical protein
MEFCPHCHHPLDDPTPDDSSRLCQACSWFGDQAEVATKPYVSDDVDLSCSQLLAMFREVCRMEMVAEQLTEEWPDEAKRLSVVKQRVKHAQYSILHFFREIRKHD